MLRAENTRGTIQRSEEVPVSLDSAEARLISRVWEALRRNTEFIDDCVERAKLSKGSAGAARRKKHLCNKWGVDCFNHRKSFSALTRKDKSLYLESGPFIYIWARLNGNCVTEADKIVQCPEWEEVVKTITQCLKIQDKRTLSRLLHGRLKSTAQLKKLQLNKPLWPKRIHLTVDVDENPIPVLAQILSIMRIAREQRALFGHAPFYAKRINQRVERLAKQLDSSLLTGGHFDPAQDEEAFAVWDCLKSGMKSDAVAQKIWPREYRKGYFALGEKLPQRIQDYKTRVDGWIKLYPSIIRVDGVKKK